MKKLLSLALVAIFFVSCSDDDGPTVDMSQLTQKWYFVSYDVNGEIFPYDDHEDCGKDYIEFLDNGTMRFVDVWDCEDDIDEGTYTVDGNNLILNFGPGDSETAKVISLTSTDFVIETTYIEDGVTVNEKINFKNSL